MDLRTNRDEFMLPNGVTDIGAGEALRTKTQPTIKKLTVVMDKVGFSDKIVTFYRKNLIAMQKDGDPGEYDEIINHLYDQYGGVSVGIELMRHFHKGDQTLLDAAVKGAKRMILDDKRANIWSDNLQADFVMLSDMTIRQIAAIEVDSEKYSKTARKNAENIELATDARAGYWLFDPMLDAFLLDPSLRPAIRDFVIDNRKRIFGDSLTLKEGIAEQFLEIIDEIDDSIENAETIKDVLTERVTTVIDRYAAVKDDINQIKNYQPDVVLTVEKGDGE
jgi:hypothetical protein